MSTASHESLNFPKEPPLPPIKSNYNASTNTGGDIRSSVHSDSNPPSVLEDVSVSGKLNNVEAQRIMSVIQEIQRKVQLIGLLPDVIDKRVSSVFGGDTFNLIKDHRQLELKYKLLMDAKSLGDKNIKNHEVSTEIKDTSRSLRTSTRSLTRHFQQNQSALNKLRYLKSTKPQTVAQFEHLLQEIKNLTYERLKITVEEEKMKQDQLSVIIAKEQKTSNEVKVLKEELERAKKDRMQDINKKNEVIRKLKEELREIKQQAEDATRKLESRSKSKEDSDMQQYMDRESILKNEIATFKANLAELNLKNREEEALFRKRKFKIESEVENWITKYDQEMDEKQVEIDDISVIFEEEKNQLAQLQAKHAEVKKKYDTIMEERRLAEEERKAKEELFAKQVRAITLIQALYRGWRIRRAMARAKDKGKKKK